jgi:hypothetical protein
MAQQHFLTNREIEMVLLALQAFQVLFLRSSHQVKTAISPRSKLPIGRQTGSYPGRTDQ